PLRPSNFAAFALALAGLAPVPERTTPDDVARIIRDILRTMDEPADDAQVAAVVAEIEARVEVSTSGLASVVKATLASVVKATLASLQSWHERGKAGVVVMRGPVRGSRTYRGSVTML